MGDTRQDNMTDPYQRVIACMGPTGAGKSAFMSMIGGISVRVGHGLSSCTQEVQVSSALIDDIPVTLVDTPGFDDTKNSDTKILRLIANYLEASYSQGFRLTGLIYFHRITDNRVGGVTAKNMRMFHSLCGDAALSNVVLCTTMWDLVDPALGEQREQDLRTNFWVDMLAKGSGVARHDKTRESALAIVRDIMQRERVTLGLQDQLAKGVPLNKTDAGKQVNAEILAMQADHKREMEALRREMESASGRKLQELKAELQDEANGLRQKQREMEDLAAARFEEVEALRRQLADRDTGRPHKWCPIM